jgi:hypothetical protein
MTMTLANRLPGINFGELRIDANCSGRDSAMCIAEQVLSGRMDDVVNTIERNVPLD